MFSARVNEISHTMSTRLRSTDNHKHRLDLVSRATKNVTVRPIKQSDMEYLIISVALDVVSELVKLNPDVRKHTLDFIKENKTTDLSTKEPSVEPIGAKRKEYDSRTNVRNKLRITDDRIEHTDLVNQQLDYDRLSSSVSEKMFGEGRYSTGQHYNVFGGIPDRHIPSVVFESASAVGDVTRSLLEDDLHKTFFIHQNVKLLNEKYLSHVIVFLSVGVVMQQYYSKVGNTYEKRSDPDLEQIKKLTGTYSQASVATKNRVEREDLLVDMIEQVVKFHRPDIDDISREFQSQVEHVKDTLHEIGVDIEIDAKTGIVNENSAQIYDMRRILDHRKTLILGAAIGIGVLGAIQTGLFGYTHSYITNTVGVDGPLTNGLDAARGMFPTTQSVTEFFVEANRRANFITQVRRIARQHAVVREAAIRGGDVGQVGSILGAGMTLSILGLVLLRGSGGVAPGDDLGF